MTVIWGLDMKEMQWGKFKSSYMFKNRDYHLRRTKFVTYQAAMILLVVSESLGTAVLSDYVSQQRRLQGTYPGIDVYNNDYVGVASFNIFIGVAIATVFGAAFFFDLFWPLRHEPPSIQWAWQGCAIFLCVAGLADALAYTTVLSLHDERVTGQENLSPQQQFQLAQDIGADWNKVPLSYRSSGRAVASVVLLWLGWVATIASTIVMIKFYAHVRRTRTAKAPHLVDEVETVNAYGEKSQETS